MRGEPLDDGRRDRPHREHRLALGLFAPAGRPRRSAGHRVVQVVPGLARWRCEGFVPFFTCLRGHPLDDRIELVVYELLAVLTRLPDVEDAKDAGVMIETSRVYEQ